MVDEQQMIDDEIGRLTTQSGVHFLLFSDGYRVICNETIYPLPNLARNLHELLRNQALLCSFATNQEAAKALTEITRSKAIMPGAIKGAVPVEKSPIEQVRFRGGSYSTTFATYKKDHWIVVKKCQRRNHIDKDLRLIAEMDFILTLPAKAQQLFPAILSRSINKQQIRYEIEYVPYCNFAELIRSNCYEAGQLSDLLLSLYDTLFEVLYIPRDPGHPWIHIEQYYQVITRRFQDIQEQLASDHYLHAFITARQIMINGTPYPGLQETIERAKQFLKDKRIPDTYNHGDLIFQDVLMDPVSKDFRLIDGNGHSSSYMYDMAKTLLCLETKYDLYYHGDFSLRIQRGDIPQANLSLHSHDTSRSIDVMSDAFWHYLAENERDFFAEVPEWRKTLLVLCGLQNIAIVMFHALHHKKYERACAFLLNGVKLINDTL